MSRIVPDVFALIFGVALGALFAVPVLAADSAKLTPRPAETAVVPSWTVVQPSTPTVRPLPKVVGLPAPRRLAPPMSPPLAGMSEGGGGVVMVPPVVARQPEASAVETVIRYAATEINLRTRPDGSAPRIDVIDEGTRLEVIGPVVNNEWVKVSRRGRVLGYVAVGFLLPRPPKPR
ncbi:MAG: SH3 domain-containing protein [Rhodospirillaceae bacterium]